MPEENVSRTLFEANAALNSQEFANRQILIKGDGPPSGLAPFGATYLDQTANPPVLYRQIDAGVASNWMAEGGGGGGSSIGGAIFITDIEPQDQLDNVGQKVFSSDGNVLDSCIADTDLIRVHVLAALGHTNYKPLIQVDGQAVILAQDEDQSIWTGFIDLDRGGATTIQATHEDGATHQVSIITDIGPEVLTAEFTGGYPGSQTELKAGDSFQLTVSTDTDMTRIEVEDLGAGQTEVFDFSATTSSTITLTIADRGNSAQLIGARIRAMNANGSYGSFFDTDSAGSVDGQHVVNLNNLYPAGIIDAIQYPNSQQALKDNEQAGVDLNAFDYDTLLYESPNGQLSIVDPTVFAPFKTVSRIAGDYNVDTNNIRITMTRTANAAETIAEAIVYIAHLDPQVAVLEPDTRLRSGGYHGTQIQNHLITLAADQELLEPPVISVPHGTLESVMADSGDQMVWTQNLRVHDDDEKGVFSFSLTQAKNLAGKIVNQLSGDKDYELGGFVSRTITVPAFAHELDLLVKVSDTSKVVARDKDLALLTYKNNLNDQTKTYAITGPSDVLNVNGDLFHWTDEQAVNNNTTGQATITIEEIV